MVNIEKIHSILSKEVKNYKVPVVDLIKLKTDDPFKVLLGTILSARTKDETTLQASKRLFSKVKKPSDLNKLSQPEIEKLIFPVGFYKTKARHLKQLPIVLAEKFNNDIPESVDELLELPGVGRKTANLVVTIGFGKPAMCVDTHVHRISNRLGYVSTKTPFETEMVLRKKLPLYLWRSYNSVIVAFGQHICVPVAPWCSKCPVRVLCPRVDVKKFR